MKKETKRIAKLINAVCEAQDCLNQRRENNFHYYLKTQQKKRAALA